MKCLLKACSNTIPKIRKKSAKYCSDECYYNAQKERNINRYNIIKAPAEELKRCEGILAYLYGVAELNKALSPQDLQTLGFNFGISTREHLDDKKRLFKVVGKYAWHIDAAKNLIIWKSK